MAPPPPRARRAPPSTPPVTACAPPRVLPPARANARAPHPPRRPTARLAPVDAVEEHWVGEIAFALWHQQRLQPLAALALAAAESGTDEPEMSRLPSLATLARYRARTERDLKLAQQSLEAARQSRPRLPSDPDLANPARLRWLADRIEARLPKARPPTTQANPSPQRLSHERTHARPNRGLLHEQTRATAAGRARPRACRRAHAEAPARPTATNAAGSWCWAGKRTRRPAVPAPAPTGSAMGSAMGRTSTRRQGW